VQVDPDRLGEVLANLLENALRHTPAGGTASISARNGAGTVEFAVSDSGEGIAPEHLARVFERFYRADRARDRAHGGSGIGLAIAKAIVEGHGGRVSAESAGPGGGATFRVTLPAGLAAVAR
jgi:signal transduction histidine kinase